MRIAGTRIEHDVFHSPCPTYSPSSFIPAPQIAVDHNGGDSLAVVQMFVPYESRYYFFNCLFD